MKPGWDILSAAILGAVIFTDQATKYAASRRLLLGDSITIIPGLFNLAHSRNTGAVWGILQQQQGWLILLSIIVLLLILIFHNRIMCGGTAYRIATALMAGGIVGNLIDRIKHGWVTDFLDFHIASAHWPCFNIADAAICTGVGLYLLASLREPGRKDGQLR